MRLAALVLSVSVLVMAGCSSNFEVPAVTSTASVGAIHGVIHGGQQAIQGAHVYLFAVGTSGYGGQSTSLLNNIPDVTTADTTTFPGSTIYYVTSSSAATGGQFSITGEYTCTSGTAIYLYATGGSSDGGADTNSGIGMLAGLGVCPVTGSLALQTPTVTINEVSTVATAYALAGFATDATHISSSGSTLATLGVANAIANVPNILDIASGTALRTTSAGGSVGTVSFLVINSLANILSNCINSKNSAQTGCTTLFGAATADSTPDGTKPTETATATINIAHYPGSNVSTIYSLNPATAAPFGNALPSQPNDFSVAVNYTGGTLGQPLGIAIDASGDAYIANGGPSNATVSRLTPLGVALSSITGGGLAHPTGIAFTPDASAFYVTSSNGAGNVSYFSASGTALASGGYAAGGVPYGIALDSQSNPWIANLGNNSLIQYSAVSPGTVSATVTSTSLIQPYAVAIDGAGNVWAPSNSGKLIEASSVGTLLSGTNGYTGGGLFAPNCIAMDSAGNAWIGNSADDTVSKFSNAGIAISTSAGYKGGGIDTPAGIAIDGLGTVWIANEGGNSISHFGADGNPISASVGYQNGNLTLPSGIAIDASGNVWVTGSGNNSVAMFLGAGAPVITPLAAGLPATYNTDGTSNLGTRP